MGRHSRSKGQRNRSGRGNNNSKHNNKDNNNKNNHKNNARTTSGRDFVLTTVANGNFHMEVYYAIQGLHNQSFQGNTLVDCVNETDRQEERMRWRNCIGTILPASFRISKDLHPSLQQQLEDELQALLDQVVLSESSKSSTAVNSNGDIIEENTGHDVATTNTETAVAVTSSSTTDAAAPTTHTTNSASPEPTTSAAATTTAVLKKLSFLPHAYQLTLDRAALRKERSLKRIQDWLLQQTGCGHITRQETVSMIPPVVLDVQPDDLVLDMCAAPGSKTSQMLEDLGPQGCIIANDASPQRAYMLTTQLRRVMHNNPVVMISAANAQFFPNIVQFDRILADVPCSGDGTSRKNIGVWKSWSQMSALSLHALQLDIAWKGASQLLKVKSVNNNSGNDSGIKMESAENSGKLESNNNDNEVDPSSNSKGQAYMVYSTCSLNPIENEAVVAALLRKAQGRLELVKIELEGFKVRPGWHTWKVMCQDKTKREIKDENKKNNAKMQERRKEWESKGIKSKNNDAAPNETKSNDSDIEPVAAETLIKDKPDTDLNQEDNPNKNNNESNSNGSKLIFEPEDMSDETLHRLGKEADYIFYDSYSDVPEHLQRRVRETCFPPTPDEVERFGLDKCVRCLPHDNDTGGFFIALLRKTGPISAVDRRAAKASGGSPDTKRVKTELDEVEKNEDNDDKTGENSFVADNAYDVNDDVALDNDNKPVRGRNGPRKNTKDDERYIPVNKDILDPLIEYYGLYTIQSDLLMTRAHGEQKVINYISPSVKVLIDLGIQDKIQMINTGLKALVRNNRDCEITHRIAQEGASFLAPHVTKRKVTACREDFEKCLTALSISLDDFSSGFREAVKPLSVGSFLVVLSIPTNEGYDGKMVLSMWRCRREEINGLIAKVDIEAIKQKLHTI